MATSQDMSINPNLSVDQLREMFKPFDIRYNQEKYKLSYPKPLLRKASVLIPLKWRDGEYSVILTLRSKDLTHHAGYVAFPGGMMDDTDTDEIHTALREAEEEIGLDPKLVDVVGIFSPAIVKPNSLVYPVLGIVSNNFVPKMSEAEVSMVFEIPLRRFLSDERMRVEQFHSTIQATYHVHHFIDTVQGKDVDTWGFTAVYCIMPALVVYQSDKEFCFFQKYVINKETAFDGYATHLIIQSMLNLNKL